jgi:hypothetical protein
MVILEKGAGGKQPVSGIFRLRLSHQQHPFRQVKPLVSLNEDSMIEKPTSAPPENEAALLDLGVVLGQTHAFALVAGRCSAAQAQGIHRLREEKLYKHCSRNWNEFCSKYLNISQVEADRTIKLLQEFGPAYFDLSQLTRISPETYRAIAPAVKGGALYVNGEAIALIPENSRKVSAAVAELREVAREGQPGFRAVDRITNLDKRCMEIIAEFQHLARTETECERRVLFTGVLRRVSNRLWRIARECGSR